MSEYIFLLLSLFFLICFISLTIIMKKDKLTQLDISISEKVQSRINNVLTNIFKVITFLGSFPGLVICIGITFFILDNKLDKSVLIIGMMIEALLNQVLKYYIHRPRPKTKPLVKERGYSFPSGHSMASSCYGFFLSFFLLKSSLIIEFKIIFLSIIFILVLLIMFSRVYLGVHYTSDTWAGLLFSLFYGCIMIFVYYHFLILL